MLFYLENIIILYDKTYTKLIYRFHYDWNLQFKVLALYSSYCNWKKNCQPLIFSKETKNVLSHWKEQIEQNFKAFTGFSKMFM